MAFHVFLCLLLSLLILCLLRLGSLYWPHHGPAKSAAVARRTPIHRLRHRRAPHTIAPSVASPPPSRRVWSLRLSLCAPGVRSKAGAEHRNG
jgi:hypothetical protein